MQCYLTGNAGVLAPKSIRSTWNLQLLQRRLFVAGGNYLCMAVLLLMLTLHRFGNCSNAASYHILAVEFH